MSIILLLPTNNIYANLIVKGLINNLRQDIAMIIEADTIVPGKSIAAGLKQYLFISGFYYFFAQAVKHVVFILKSLISRHPESIFSSYKIMAKAYAIPVIKTNNINSSAASSIIRNARPDWIVSLYFRQILKKDILEIPQQGCLNVHPGRLPAYRGVSPIFWALCQGDDIIGLTIHFITRQTDQGDIIACKSVPVNKQDTEHSLFLKCSALSVPMLLEIISQQRCSAVRQEGSGRYFSLPTKDAVRAFKLRGRKFFRVKEVFYARTA